jgi:hypothetical protein
MIPGAFFLPASQNSKENQHKKQNSDDRCKKDDDGRDHN